MAGEGATFTHLDAAGRAHMVDVNAKPETSRRALARCRVEVGEAVAAALSGTGALAAPHGVRWAEVLGAAEIAGIQAAKQTASLIPLCHPLTVSGLQVRLAVAGSAVEIEAVAEVVGRTGVEMEALTACAVAGVTVASAAIECYPETHLEELALYEKSGGRTGEFTRPVSPGGRSTDRRDDRRD